MWYLAEILLAEPEQAGLATSRCESCDVLFSATTAAEAHGKAVAWGSRYASSPPATMRLLGVAHLTQIGDELGDGVEIHGRYFEAANPWQRLGDLVPPLAELTAIRWEAESDTPLVQLLDATQIERLKRRVGEPD